MARNDDEQKIYRTFEEFERDELRKLDGGKAPLFGWMSGKRRDQLLGDLPDAFALLKKKYASNYPSFISFITGPSRTGDIERILVLGAHGPRKLTIFCF